MNRGLMWSLIGTLVLSAGALFYPRSSGDAVSNGAVVQAVRPDANDANHSSAQALGITTNAKVPANPASFGADAFPSHWPIPTMEPAARSPFSQPVPPAPKVAALAHVASAAPPPTPPPANFRFWGRLSSPDKQVLVFLVKGQDGVPIEVQHGTRLDDGWTVESISDNAIALVNAISQQRTTILVPLADPAQAR